MAERADDDLNRREFLDDWARDHFPDVTRGRWRANPKLDIVSV